MCSSDLWNGSSNRAAGTSKGSRRGAVCPVRAMRCAGAVAGSRPQFTFLMAQGYGTMHTLRRALAQGVHVFAAALGSSEGQ